MLLKIGELVVVVKRTIILVGWTNIATQALMEEVAGEVEANHLHQKNALGNVSSISKHQSIKENSSFGEFGLPSKENYTDSEEKSNEDSVKTETIASIIVVWDDCPIAEYMDRVNKGVFEYTVEIR